MKPSWRKVRTDDNPKIEQVLSSVNDFADSVVRIMDGAIDLPENAGATVVELTITTLSGSVPVKVTRKPVLVVKTNIVKQDGIGIGNAFDFAWRWDGTNVVVTDFYGLTAGVTYILTLCMI